jgi:uncharacterized damage-inducible protein DinB
MGAIDEIIYLMEEAFRGGGIEETNESQSLLANIATVDDGSWRTPPPSGRRTIRSVVLHVGSCKVMYDDYAFGSAGRSWDDPAVAPWPDGDAPRIDAVEWLTNAHGRLVDHVRALNEDDLSRPRLANWGEQRETRWLISTLIQHDAYHAGEINHIRALLRSDDAWRWPAPGD